MNCPLEPNASPAAARSCRSGWARLRAALLTLSFLALLLAWAGVARTAETDPQELIKTGDAAFKASNFADAARAYEQALTLKPDLDNWEQISRQIVFARLRLREFDPAEEAGKAYLARALGKPQEAPARRFLGNLYLVLPHWGTRAGGVFHRGQWLQGIQLQSHRHDKKLALEHLEKARELYAAVAADAKALAALPPAQRDAWPEQRINCLFDLAAACARFGVFERDPSYWGGDMDEATAQSAGSEDFEEYHSRWQNRRHRPLGLPLDEQGQPVFAALPKQYAPDLTDDQKVLFLLAEVRQLDNTAERQFAARSVYRQAMLARARFGMDRINQIYNYFQGPGQSLDKELARIQPWTLTDRQATVLAGGKLVVVELPAQWDVLGLLATVENEYAKSDSADQASLAIGLYHQSRQQYVTALGQYDKMAKLFPQSNWLNQAQQQKDVILASEAQVQQLGVQLPPARQGQQAQGVALQVTYRNTAKIYLVARKIDHQGLLRAVHADPIREEKGMQNFHLLEQWDQLFVNEHYGDPQSALAGKFLGPEVARWEVPVAPEASHRSAQAIVNSPLREPGAYLILAFTSEPPADLAGKPLVELRKLGQSRAVCVINDLALVEKKNQAGNLYFVCDAVTGGPVAQAKLQILAVWNTWDQMGKRSVFHKKIIALTSDEQGMAVLDKTHIENHPRLHVLIDAGARFAWSGMDYWQPYHPSTMQRGNLAYVITDRPVYRPQQVVRYKVWLRQMQEGILSNAANQSVSLAIFDPRGNEIAALNKDSDAFGGLEGELKLPADATLGMYQVRVRYDWRTGGGSFRVEEYKKPEFEVSVTTGKSHAKLGEKVTALIKARYYFGAPVDQGNVSYKVFREEYQASYYFPGPWDWLYGAGYGLPWYSYDWLPFWSWRCSVPPAWWWGFYPGMGGQPVRELVQQGKGLLKADGALEVTIDTAPALSSHGDKDHRYIIEAEVVDASRRVIQGSGTVTATRQAFFAAVQSDRGYYRPGDEVVIQFACMTPEGRPIQSQGKVSLSQVTYGRDADHPNPQVEEKQLQQWDIQTDERGQASIRFRPEKSGQFKVQAQYPDAWGGQVTGLHLFWVCGQDFAGEIHRFNDLEMITDQRTYQPGDVAHVMLATNQANSYVLFADEVDNGRVISYRLLHIPGKSLVVDVPIKKGHGPNFFLEATTVAGGRTHEQVLQLNVPPEKAILSVQVESDKPSYQPGEKATVKITAKTPDGQPAAAQLVLSAFDKSVLYFQASLTPPIAQYFHGNLRHYAKSMRHNLTRQFAVWSGLRQPSQYIYSVPPEWWGQWGPDVSDFRFADGADLGVDADDGNMLMAGDVDGIAGGGAVLNYPGAPMSKMSRSAGFAMADALSGRLSERKDGGAREEADGGGEDFAAATVRSELADSAFWLADVTTNSDGVASATFTWPQNLTTWQIATWAMTADSQVGQSETSAITSKNLLVRLQAPRFFLEYDEVVISANVHNYLEKVKTCRVSLKLPAELLALDSKTPATLDVKVPAGGQQRVDWRVRVLREGTVTLTATALSDEESDAMAMTFPVLVHGITRQVASSGILPASVVKNTATVELDLPEARRPELSRFELQFTPTLVGAMLDALPYCLDYPYGCTEQTMSRFVPALLTLKTLQDMGIRLEDIQKLRAGRMEEIRRIEKGEHISLYIDNPVFDSAQLKEIIDASLRRISSMQQGDGGWGWWTEDASNPYLSSYVLDSLITARDCDQNLQGNLLERGVQYLTNATIQEMRLPHWDVHDQAAYVAYVISRDKQRISYQPEKDDARSGDLLERLFAKRDKLSNYGRALLTLALHNLDDQRAATVLQNILQYKRENAETQLAWIRTPETGWWYWWNNDIETNAWCLRALIALEPKNEMAPRMVKWLLNNRRNGYYWRSTRDTAFCIAALAEFAKASGETDADYQLTLDYDHGAVVKTVKINKANLLTADNRFILEGAALTSGKHTLTITKDGPGALYFGSYLRFFDKQEHIPASGHELKVQRSYFRLQQIPYEVTVENAQGQPIQEKRLRYERIALKDGDTVPSGEVVQVELKITADNTYTFLCIEDPKPAGFEPVALISGGKGQEGFYSYMEVRDQKTVFFVGQTEQGDHLLRYRLRAEIPGVFHALPTQFYGMYVPELRANAEECVLKIED